MEPAGSVLKQGCWGIVRRLERKRLSAITCAVGLLLLACVSGFAQEQFEDLPVGQVSVTFEGSDKNISANETFRVIAHDAVGSTYSSVRVRDAIERLYDTRQIAAITVEANQTPAGTVNVQFIVRRKPQAQRVTVELPEDDESNVTEQDLLFRLNLLDPGMAVTEQTLQTNADMILEYLRDRGFFKAEVTYSQRPLDSEAEVGVTFRVTPNEQSTVEAFKINIAGFDSAVLADEIKLHTGEKFTRADLQLDVEKIRRLLRDDDFLAPSIDDPRVVYDSEKNAVTIELNGKVGPKVEVEVEAEHDRVGNRTQNKILPVKREGTLDFAAIVEGERRLESHYQEQGYFFVNVTPVCAIEPPLDQTDSGTIKNDTEFLCSALNSANLDDKKVILKYRVDLNRQLKLTDIRLEGTTQFSVTDIKSVLETQEANILGIIPLFGYGRGYTSERLLEQDGATIRSLLRELGYRDANVRVNQGVSPDGTSLIITFIVEEGPRTLTSGVEIAGNNAFTDDVLKAQLPPLERTYFSRAKIRNGQRRIQEFYSQAGYYDAKVDFSIDERVTDPQTGERLFKVVYTVSNEGQRVVIDRILVTGNERTKSEAILLALALRSGEYLRAADVYASEQNLYASDAFSRVEIKPRAAGQTPNGERLTDVIVNVEEQAPRILSYGGGYSTDLGASGFVDIRHLNFMGNLWQAGARLQMSQRQQLAQLDFLQPRFMKDGDKKFAPLTLTASYLRDSTITRFFRSAFDQGTFGIVQRVDEDGNPIDEFGNSTGDPTLNRLTLSAETSRTISRKNRSLVYFRYRFEDVRLYNIESLLIKELLLPDARIRISGFGVTFARDTRRNCLVKYTILDIIARGEAPEPCRYNATDPTHGDYFTADYNVSAKILGANIGFNKFQFSYQIYRTYKFLNNTTFAGRAILGMANVFSNGDRFTNTSFPELNGSLPISERFFAGGGNSIRGFDFEEAGPRVVIVPQGTFRDSDGNPVFLDPFTVPFGGNGLAIVNLEARIPLTKALRAVPFYDGGNVFKNPREIFNPSNSSPTNINEENLRAVWTHTVGLGLRLKTPFGGAFAIDFGYLLNPPRFVIPQVNAPNAIYQLHREHVHFRFSQAF
ncbi:MAG TPA: POTRA domain-containing protein [Pyrinomonadaceae bacterium]|nr:POTRA domain-containing protein [Pyrinomonadaceae bacterium]